jgi:hypothetical protein
MPRVFFSFGSAHTHVRSSSVMVTAESPVFFSISVFDGRSFSRTSPNSHILGVTLNRANDSVEPHTDNSSENFKTGTQRHRDTEVSPATQVSGLLFLHAPEMKKVVSFLLQNNGSLEPQKKRTPP